MSQLFYFKAKLPGQGIIPIKEDEQRKDRRAEIRKQNGRTITESVIPIASHHRLYDVFYASAKKHNFTIVKKELEE